MQQGRLNTRVSLKPASPRQVGQFSVGANTYGNPAAGLDSHFYSASPQECVATLENFGDDWLPEAAEVFEMELPDTTTGDCPPDRVPVHRLWNNRADSSHRFVKSLALRAQMIARGFISEGYGPNGVVFCALPLRSRNLHSAHRRTHLE